MLGAGGSHLVALRHWLEDEREAGITHLRSSVRSMEDYRAHTAVLNFIDKVEDHIRDLLQDRQVLAGREDE